MNDFKEKLSEVVKDLRSQRLLPVIAVLVVAIIAVPMVLKAGGQEPAPPTELSVGLKPMLENDPILVAETPELRDFRERLDKYSQKNPFHQPKPPKAPASETDAAATDAAATDGTVTDVSSTEDTSTVPPVDDTTTPDTGDTGGTTPDTGDDSTGTGDAVISYDIDVEIGKVGEEKTMEGVKGTTLLPNSKNPLLQFVNTDLQGTFAVFIISPDVTGSDGDANCSPTPQDCQFLKMEVGDAQKLSYGINGETYRIKLLAITRQVDVLEKVMNATDEVTDPIEFATQWKTG